MSFLLIANPTAGAGAGRVNKQRLIEVAVRDLERDGNTVEVALEENRAAVEARAEKAVAQNYRAVIAAGGDGWNNQRRRQRLDALPKSTPELRRIAIQNPKSKIQNR